MYTLSDIKSRVLDIIGEDSAAPTFWDSTQDGEIEDYINDAVEEACTLIPHYKEDIYLPLLTNKKHYRISPGKGGQFLYISNMRIIPDERDVEMVGAGQVARNDYRWMTSTGRPNRFFRIGVETIRVIPYPEQDGDTLVMSCVVIPPRYTENDELIDIHDTFIGIVVSYAAYMLFLSLRMIDKAGVQLERYSTLLGDYNVDATSMKQTAFKLRSVDNAGIY